MFVVAFCNTTLNRPVILTNVTFATKPRHMKVKALYLNFLLLVFGCKLAAQPIPQLYGLSGGGQYGFGTIFKTNYIDNGAGYYGYGVTAVYSFDSITGAAPRKLIKGSNGLLYGCTFSGGTSNTGVVFSLNPSNGQFTLLHQFDALERHPGDLLYGIDGNLYGLAEGGNIGSGFIFKVNPATGNYSNVYNFQNRFAPNVQGYGSPRKLIQASNGKLYGTALGGSYSSTSMHTGGKIFSFDLASGIFTELFVFADTANCRQPESILQASNTKIYGNTFLGKGIFSYDIQTGACTTLAHTVGYNKLNSADNGLFYLVYPTALYAFDISDNSVTNVDVSFSPENYNPDFIQGSDYKLYGTSPSSGPYNGKLFWIDIYRGNTLRNFIEFSSSDIYLNPHSLVEVPADTNNCNSYFQVYPDLSVPGLCRGYNLSTGTGLSYLWEFGDGTTSPSPSPQHIYAQPGIYRLCLTVTSTNGCSDIFCDSSYAFKTEGQPMSQLIIEQSATDLSNLPQDELVFVSPNPAQNVLSINAGELQIEEVTIYNVQGQIINHTKNPGVNKLDVSQLMSGTYIIEVKTLNASIKKRWVKL